MAKRSAARKRQNRAAPKPQGNHGPAPALKDNAASKLDTFIESATSALEEALNDPEVEGIAIATPAWT